MLDQARPVGHRLPSLIEVPGPRAGLLSRAGRRTIIGLVVGAFAFSLLAAATGRPPALIPASGAEQLVGSDGHREILAGPLSTQVRGTGHQPGNRPWVDGPWWFFLGLDDSEQAITRYWIVETEDDSAGGTPHLLRLDATGLHTQVTGWPEIRHFEPARLEVPARPRPGQRVITTGRTETLAGPGGAAQEAYTSVVEVLDAPDAGAGCLEFRRTDTIGAAVPTATSRVRCPGRGVVRLQLPTGRWNAVGNWPQQADPRPGLDLTDPPPGPLTGLSPHSIVFMRGQLESTVPPVGPLQSVGEQYVLAAVSTGNLLWLKPTAGHYELSVWVDVGGDIAGIAQCGEVIVAATSRRTVIAHDGTGRWLWTTELDDVVGSHPVRSGDDLLVATKDGRLTALGCRDGAERWHTDGVGSAVSPAVGTAGILAAGDSSVRLLDPLTGQERWERRLPDQPRAVTFSGALAVAADNGDRIHGLGSSDGLPVWNQRLVDTTVELHDLGPVVVVRTATGLIGIDRHGQRQWRKDFRAMDSVDDDRHVFAADVRGIVVVDAAGRVVERTDRPLHPNAAAIHLNRTPTGVLAADGLGTLVAWRTP